MLELTEATFAEAMANDRPLVVDFWATWCSPCRAMAPAFEKLATEHADKAVFAKVDIDELSDIAVNHRIAHIPTVIVFREGKECKRWVGLPAARELVEAIS